MTEYEIYTMFNSGRLVGAVSFIGSIIAIWLALRVANLTRENADTTVIQKIVSSAFGLIVLAGTFISFTQAKATWVITAYNLELLETRSEFSDGFIGYVGTTTLPVESPSAMGMIFLAVVALMILSIIWTPKK
jgi:O-antigen/teichoic acid export membrane protein